MMMRSIFWARLYRYDEPRRSRYYYFSSSLRTAVAARWLTLRSTLLRAAQSLASALSARVFYALC